MNGSACCLSQKREARAEPAALGRVLERGVARDQGRPWPCLPCVPSWVCGPELARRRHRGAQRLPLGAGGNRARPSLSCPPRELLGGPQAWPLLLATCLVPGVLQLASLPLLPESPRYLLIDCGDPAACQAGEPLAWVPGPPLTMGHMWSAHMGPFLMWEKLLLSLRPHFRLQPSPPRSLQGLS